MEAGLDKSVRLFVHDNEAWNASSEPIAIVNARMHKKQGCGRLLGSQELDCTTTTIIIIINQ